MSNIAIRCENLGKQYRIGKRESSKTLRDTLTDAMYAPVRKIRSAFQKNGKPANGESAIWALNDVSFEIKHGEVVGVIGRNGAGKSTLLKILSRITDPTRGQAAIHGRVGSLLEVGTGFHPELTGRENIYLNGAILGMRKADIERKFDEIVAFAEVDRFLDTPVKHYSSGMHMRLAFAVAAHLEPDILVVDEVLAVGDTEFQKKCLGKMNDIAKEARTVLFVSHNMGAVNDLCSRCLLLNRGNIIMDGRTEAVTQFYLGQYENKTGLAAFNPIPSEAHFDAVELHDEEGIPRSIFDIRKPITVYFRFTLKSRNPGLHVSISLINGRGTHIFYHSNAYAKPPVLIEDKGSYELVAQIPGNLLVPENYSINVALHKPNVEMFDYREAALSFEVEDMGSGRYEYSGSDIGCVLADLEWTRL
jgi:lipopolysaccharide transport system ATP-binding protein